MKNNLRTFSIISLGCPKNLVDSEVVIGLLEQAGYKMVPPNHSWMKNADILLVNTCAFIRPAKEEAVQTIRELVEYKKIGNCKKLFVLGCLPQRELAKSNPRPCLQQAGVGGQNPNAKCQQKELITAFPEVDGWVGAGEFYQIVNLLNQSQNELPVIAIAQPTFIYDHTTPRHLATLAHTAYVKIAEGCNHGCSFCTVPRIRGRFRSRPLESIVVEVEELTQRGVKEINLIAQDITEYGRDIYHGFALVMLLKKLVQISALHWIRLLYAYPTNFSDELIALIAQENKLCKYIDLPIQHIDATILRSMNRQTTRNQFYKLIEKLRNRIPEVTIRTSLITGYPGETELQFKNLVAFVKKIKFDRLGVFPYSREASTAAYYLCPQLAEETKQNRAERIMQIQQKIVLEKNNRFLGKQVTVLIDSRLKKQRNWYVGRTQAHAPDIDGVVYVRNKTKPAIEPGDFVQATIVAVQDYDLIAECGIRSVKCGMKTYSAIRNPH
ncbi:MAG: 30S ribosomal protein S12 methylthiotransferase RimO [bacterium]|nr:30S ribosomal protein S12 methylthiotransferase RimO [bacterium]